MYKLPYSIESYEPDVLPEEETPTNHFLKLAFTARNQNQNILPNPLRTNMGQIQTAYTPRQVPNNKNYILINNNNLPKNNLAPNNNLNNGDFKHLINTVDFTNSTDENINKINVPYPTFNQSPFNLQTPFIKQQNYKAKTNDQKPQPFIQNLMTPEKVSKIMLPVRMRNPSPHITRKNTYNINNSNLAIKAGILSPVIMNKNVYNFNNNNAGLKMRNPSPVTVQKNAFNINNNNEALKMKNPTPSPVIVRKNTYNFNNNIALKMRNPSPITLNKNNYNLKNNNIILVRNNSPPLLNQNTLNYGQHLLPVYHHKIINRIKTS